MFVTTSNFKLERKLRFFLRNLSNIAVPRAGGEEENTKY